MVRCVSSHRCPLRCDPQWVCPYRLSSIYADALADGNACRAVRHCRAFSFLLLQVALVAGDVAIGLNVGAFDPVATFLLPAPPVKRV